MGDKSRMIILDLEWNRGYDKKPVDEILQIGAVRVDTPGAPITDVYNAYIRPILHKRFDVGAKKLPELQRSLDSDLTFPEALEGFRAWCGGEEVFGGWGCDDVAALNRNCAYYGLPPIEIKTMVNIQMAYCHAVGAGNTQIALWRAVAYCGIPDVFCYHNALNDAMYTASLCKWLTEEDLNWRPPKAEPKRRSQRFSHLPFTAGPRRKVGPMPSAREVLDSKVCRRPACPICGENVWVAEWHTRDQRHYYAPFCCPEHGRFLCRLTLAPLEDGMWRGRLAVPELTPELLAAYGDSLKGELHRCKPLSRRRRRRRQRVAEGV